MAADLGLEATGVDLAGTALDRARQKAADRGLSVRFIQHDARRLAEMGESFDTVLDCGLFHIFDDDDRAAYVGGLRSVVEAGGRYFMLGFSDQQPGDDGPHRLTRVDIESAFADGWDIDSIEPATIDITGDPDGVRAWLAALTKI
jgi:cyclopropane fatty-acyl-phospholipid synthase-like methyltransferase